MFPITLISFLFLFSGPAHVGPGEAGILASEREHSLSDTLADGIFTYVNRDRKSKGLHPLRLDPEESAIAAKHSRDMASGKTPFGHAGAEGRQKQIKSKLGYLQAFGENVAYGQQSAREVVENWLESQQHKENIEGNFTLTGIGWAKDANGVLYFTEIFTR